MNGIHNASDFAEALMRSYDEGTARGPMTDDPVSWEWLAEQEPGLERLEARCKRLANPHKAYKNWYGGPGGGRIRYEVAALVGYGRANPKGHPNLYGPDAYDVAYQRLLGTLEGKKR